MDVALRTQARAERLREALAWAGETAKQLRLEATSRAAESEERIECMCIFRIV